MAELHKVHLLLQGSTDTSTNTFRKTLSEDPTLALEVSAFLDLLNKKRITTKLNPSPDNGSL